eukprot:m.76609 g.76609  ORF g.76609 m.76609 type:complete len:88 (-) comp24919_c0_seq1:428-691(-)
MASRYKRSIPLSLFMSAATPLAAPPKTPPTGFATCVRTAPTLDIAQEVVSSKIRNDISANACDGLDHRLLEVLRAFGDVDNDDERLR